MFWLRQAVGVSLTLGFGLDEFGGHFAQENVLNLGGAEVSGQFVLCGLKQSLGGNVGSQVLAQYGDDLGNQFRACLGGGFLALGAGLSLGFIRSRAGLGKLFNHLGQDFADFGFGLGDESQGGGQSDGLGDVLLHSVTLSGF